MRTLAELLDVARKVEADYKSIADASNKEYAEAKQAIEKAKHDAEASVAIGDNEAYTAAKHAEDYNKTRALALYQKAIFPVLSVAEQDALVSELSAAFRAEVKPHYKRIYELIHEYENELKKIDELCSMINAAGASLSRAKPTLQKYVSAGGDSSDFTHYEWTPRQYVSEELKVFGSKLPGMYKRCIMPYYNHEKEVASHE